MTDSDLVKLVDDTLYDRREPPGNSCFAHNVAGMDLIQCDESALPHIERALREVVAQHSASEFEQAFLGLSYLLGAYEIIGAKHDPSRIIAFVRTLPIHLQAEFVAVLPIWFEKNQGSYRHGVTLPQEFLLFAEEAECSEAELLRQKARRASAFLRGESGVIR